MKKTEYKALAELLRGTAETLACIVGDEAERDGLFDAIYSALHEWRHIFEERAKGD